ncbi:MAG: sigma-70 family RNA polymerase sigma factor [Planctomycetes bacterium]|nr:sigma-70 family RNA polymerase sigma factor [Planctomycetota bacterium]
MTESPDETVVLLRRWHQGDQRALAVLVERELPWMRNYVHGRLGQLLRARGETDDYVQEAMLHVLRYGPRFVTDNRDAFRRLLARIVENSLRDMADWHGAERRALRRERPVPSDSVLHLDRPHETVTRPSQDAERHEQEAWVALALELLEPDDRAVILLRQWEGLEFAAVGQRLGVAEDTARMRFQRALPRLARKLEALRSGSWDGAVPG